MFEKKKLIVNCEMCDARTICEEDYAKYENIMINTELLLVNDRAKSVLARLPVTLNAEETISVPEDMQIDLHSVNGSTQIGPDTVFAENTLLTVNGSLSVLSGAQQALEKCYRVVVNGSIFLPQSMTGVLAKITVNGSAEIYPDGAVILDKYFELDRFFPLRAKQDTVYFAAKRIAVMDEKTDAKKLAEKNITFVTPRLAAPERLIEELAPLVDINTEIIVVPEGFALIANDAKLDEALPGKYGKKLFVLGNLKIPAGSAQLIGKLEGLCVQGEVRVTRSDVQALEAIGAQYDSLKIVRSKSIGNCPMVTIDQNLLDSSPDGVTIGNAALVRIDAALAPETIMEKLDIQNAAAVECTLQQRGAVAAVAQNVAHIGPGDEENAEGGLGSILSSVFGANALSDTKVVNSETHVL